MESNSFSNEYKIVQEMLHSNELDGTKDDAIFESEEEYSDIN